MIVFLPLFQPRFRTSTFSQDNSGAIQSSRFRTSTFSWPVSLVSCISVPWNMDAPYCRCWNMDVPYWMINRWISVILD